MKTLRSAILIFGAVGVAAWVKISLYMMMVRFGPLRFEATDGSHAESWHLIAVELPPVVAGLFAGFLLRRIAEGGKQRFWIVGLLLVSLLGIYGLRLLNGFGPASWSGVGNAEAAVVCITSMAGWLLGRKPRPPKGVA